MADLLSSAEFAEMMLRLESALTKISTMPTTPACSSPCAVHSKVESIVTELKADVERLYGLFRGLDEAMKSYEPGKQGILSRIQDIENTLKSIEKSLKYLETDIDKNNDSGTKLHDMERDCTMCRKEVTTKLDTMIDYMKKIDTLRTDFDQDRLSRDMVEKRRSEEEAARKAETAELKKWAVGKGLFILVLVIGFVWNMIKESYDATQQAKIIQQYLQSHTAKAPTP